MLKWLREYLTLGSLATVAAVVGIGSGIYNMAGGNDSGGGGGGGTGYTPQWQGGADSLMQQILQSMGGNANAGNAALSPYLMQQLQASMGQIPGMQDQMRGYGNTIAQQAQTSFDRAGGLEAAGGQLWQTALDPQNQLRDTLQKQTVDASRAGTSARGIGMSGESAGIENQDVSNFLMNWQNQQLQRQATGLQGLTSAYGTAGQERQAGDAGLVGATQMQQGAMNLPFGLAGQYGQAMAQGVYNPYQALQGDLSTYLGLGQSGGANAFAQQQTGMNNLTSGLTQLGQQPWLQNYFGSSGGGGGGGAYDMGSQGDP